MRPKQSRTCAILAIVGIVVVFQSTASAQCLPENLLADGVAFGPESFGRIRAADFNEDGVDDLALGGILDVADFDGDGVDDVVAFEVFVRLGVGVAGRGTGVFQLLQSYPLGMSGAISIYLSRGASAPADSVLAPPLHFPVAHLGPVTAADVNGDAIKDLIVGSTAPTSVDSTMFRVLLGGGTSGQWDGTFAPAVDYRNTVPGFEGDAELRDLVLADFNADGIADVSGTPYRSAAGRVLHAE
jgi:hypothetical protein